MSKEIKEKETETIKEETSGGWFCRRCGIQLYSSDLYCQKCLEIMEKQTLNYCPYCYQYIGHFGNCPFI